jgi:hypothetical protein
VVALQEVSSTPVSISATLKNFTNLFLTHMKMSNLIPFSDAKQRDTDSGPLVKMTDFSSLMLPSFESDEDLEANSPSRQVEKLTPSTPILMPESTRATTIGSKTLSAAFVANC